jgi:hypothetical protein
VLLHDHVQRGYERELEDHESIWRSLPLFAVLAGLAGTFVNFLVGKAPPIQLDWWPAVVWALIVSNVGVYGWGIRYLVPIVRRRFHRYIADDDQVREFSNGLVEYHLARGLTQAEADAAAALETRDYLIAELAKSSSQIQKLNQIKASSRAQALFWLFVGFIFSIGLSVLIIGSAALSLPESGTHVQASGPAAARANNRSATRTADPAAAAVHRGGGEVPVPTGQPKALTPQAAIEEPGNARAVARGPKVER